MSLRGSSTNHWSSNDSTCVKCFWPSGSNRQLIHPVRAAKRKSLPPSLTRSAYASTASVDRARRSEKWEKKTVVNGRVTCLESLLLRVPTVRARASLLSGHRLSACQDG